LDVDQSINESGLLTVRNMGNNESIAPSADEKARKEIEVALEKMNISNKHNILDK
jgi:hypothetical protein